MKVGNGFKEVLVAFLIAIAILAVAYAEPTGPDSLKQIKSERMKPRASTSVPAQAGNVTELNINVTSVTKTWQGYFGNVTGRLTLADARNLSMYEWGVANPHGQVYASPSQITNWADAECFNYSASSPELNLSELEKSINVGANDPDGVNETFKYNFAGSFWVGNVRVNSTSGCKASYTYKQSQNQTVNFAEVLLTDKTNIIYTTIIEDNIMGFDNRTHDFQMLVGQNGHPGGPSTTPYYFYVELE